MLLLSSICQSFHFFIVVACFVTRNEYSIAVTELVYSYALSFRLFLRFCRQSFLRQAVVLNMSFCTSGDDHMVDETRFTFAVSWMAAVTALLYLFASLSSVGA